MPCRAGDLLRAPHLRATTRQDLRLADLLLPHPPATPPDAVVLMLGCDAEQSRAPLGDRSFSLRRARSMFTTLAPRLVDAGHAAYLLRLTVKGWNAVALVSTLAVLNHDRAVPVGGSRPRRTSGGPGCSARLAVSRRLP